MSSQVLIPGDSVVLDEFRFGSGRGIMHGVGSNGIPCIYECLRVYTVQSTKYSEGPVEICGEFTNSSWWRHATQDDVKRSAMCFP